jgi:hypothetical protein
VLCASCAVCRVPIIYLFIVSSSHRYCVSLYPGVQSAVCFVLVLDLIHVNITKTTSLGRGSAAKGGAPAHMGHRTAFGNTAEQYRLLAFGCAARGVPEQGPMGHQDGEGWVDQSLGDYADALSRRTKVCLVLVESLGGIYHANKRQLHTFSKRASGTLAVDRTRYGRASSSARSYMQHHSQRRSRAAVMSDADAIYKRIAVIQQQACFISRDALPTEDV